MKTKVIVLSVAALSIFGYSFQLATGKIFPDLAGEKLDGAKVILPKDTKGKFTLLGLAYSQKSQDDLQTWLQPVYNTFIAKPSGQVLFDESYDVNVYFIPMFTGANESAYSPMKKKFQEIDKELKPHILFYKGEISVYKKELSLEDKDKPYFFVLDKTGKIIYETSGAYSDEKMEKIEELVDEEDEE